ncbi:MAG: hypothetical protein LUP91_10345, partial [Methylococcaceae bacterium]|nr:hypothetical protein [Methylococcaceae bacterium]
MAQRASSAFPRGAWEREKKRVSTRLLSYRLHLLLQGGLNELLHRQALVVDPDLFEGFVVVLLHYLVNQLDYLT